MKGEHYKLTSFRQLRYELLTFLKDVDVDLDSDDFKKSNETFTCMKKELVRQGKGSVDHKTPIPKTDLQKLYQHSVAMTPKSPTGLLHKVAFEVIFYFCRQGFENLREMSKSTFKVFTDENGREY